MIKLDYKTCIKCGITKELEQFEFRKDQNSYRNACKECRNIESRKRYAINKDENNRKRRIKYQLNKEMINQKRRETYSLTKEEINRKRRNKLANNPIEKLKKQVASTINNSYIRKGFQRTKSIEEILGRSLDEEVALLLKHYKYKYRKEYDSTEKVHVDHIIPIRTAKTIDDVDRCNRCLQDELLNYGDKKIHLQ